MVGGSRPNQNLICGSGSSQAHSTFHKQFVNVSNLFSIVDSVLIVNISDSHDYNKILMQFTRKQEKVVRVYVLGDSCLVTVDPCRGHTSYSRPDDKRRESNSLAFGVCDTINLGSLQCRQSSRPPRALIPISTLFTWLVFFLFNRKRKFLPFEKILSVQDVKFQTRDKLEVPI
ncbi:hypothetical protein H671_1g3116 [Cricetulus griseus]|uniref:Uncharacterized protein n=1 Tax=Cricetulus griseus TaxID=10029 RepID=A0A061IM49_CRIGR|nr:hypothetical protein H671_1g3116 [Cricetulus griseus]